MYKEILITALKETMFMVGYSTMFAVIIGFILAIVLVVTDDKGLKPNKFIFSILDLLINVLRSFPFIILMIAIIPLTKLLVGKSIGTPAAIVPLTIGAAPFAARVLESALKEVEPGLIEAAKSFGATNTQILFRVMVKEAFPSIIRGIILTIINLIGYSAMAGAVGGGGLGHVAISYGYNRFNTEIMIYTVIVLIILVQIIQSFGNLVYRNLNK
ncbi:methionine ABC transporter permease [uncultured Clostridium sp.]|uniref:methionine ABC transporter permease n=1 Tax=uncultured Clostridium sp. TaxID=59620 RepID=UPI0028E8FEB3|nr:methionine ABC transporter permease [uncultured Clostridium sp.]